MDFIKQQISQNTGANQGHESVQQKEQSGGSVMNQLNNAMGGGASGEQKEGTSAIHILVLFDSRSDVLPSVQMLLTKVYPLHSISTRSSVWNADVSISTSRYRLGAGAYDEAGPAGQ